MVDYDAISTTVQPGEGGHAAHHRALAEAVKDLDERVTSGGGGGSGAVVDTVTINTGSLAADGQDTGTVALGRVSMILRVETDAPAWIRLYVSSAALAADASRVRGTAPTAGTEHGVVFDFARETGDVFDIAPPAWVYAADGTEDVAYCVENIDDTSADIEVTFTFVRIVEATP